MHHSSRKLSTAQKSGAIESLMFLKEKIDGSIKGRETVMPGDAASPTVSLEPVLITAAVKAYEGRDTAVVAVVLASYCSPIVS